MIDHIPPAETLAVLDLIDRSGTAKLHGNQAQSIALSATAIERNPAVFKFLVGGMSIGEVPEPTAPEWPEWYAHQRAHLASLIDQEGGTNA